MPSLSKCYHNVYCIVIEKLNLPVSQGFLSGSKRLSLSLIAKVAGVWGSSRLSMPPKSGGMDS